MRRGQFDPHLHGCITLRGLLCLSVRRVEVGRPKVTGSMSRGARRLDQRGRWGCNTQSALGGSTVPSPSCAKVALPSPESTQFYRGSHSDVLTRITAAAAFNLARCSSTNKVKAWISACDGGERCPCLPGVRPQHCQLSKHMRCAALAIKGMSCLAVPPVHMCPPNPCCDLPPQALKQAHELGYVHRDLRPPNILMVEAAAAEVQGLVQSSSCSLVILDWWDKGGSQWGQMGLVPNAGVPRPVH